MKLYLVGPGRKYEVYASANDPKRPRLHLAVGSGFAQKLVVYTDEDYMSGWTPADTTRVTSGAKNGVDFYVFRIPPTTHYGNHGAKTVTQIEYAARDVLVTTDDQLAEVIARLRHET